MKLLVWSLLIGACLGFWAIVVYCAGYAMGCW